MSGVIPVHSSGDGAGPTLSHQEMANRLESGQARTLSDFVTDYVQYENYWWLLAGDVWLRIDDRELEETLASYQRRMSRGLFSNET